ncbi:hypothetical protein K4K60_002411 [Colletotrichum sp. SAR11_57]|nr:hypothetical protein K4K60_002411 [Colletotrichum sp. SAR11_57]
MDPSAPHPASGWIKTWNDYNQEEVIKVHPNDNGFLKMGYIFYKAINKAADAGKLVEPGEVNSGPTICDKFERNGMEPTGEMTLFINRSKDTIGDTEVKGYWDPSPGIMFRPLRSMDRRDLHLQDWDGDDDCDIIYVNPETNAVEVFPNQLAVRSADLTGSNRANYLCIAPDGTVSGHLQQDSGAFVDVGQIKFAIGKDRANLRCDDGRVTSPNLTVQPGSDEDDDTSGGSGGDHTPYVPNPKNDNPLPTSSDASKYTTIEQLEAKAGLIDLWCGPQYTITILLQIPQDSFARYDEIMASGYYKYFKIHADYLVSNAWSALRNFMLIHSDEYFNCKITEETTCCNTPSAIPLDLFGILFSVKGIRDVSNARKAALARSAMPHADIARISTKAAAELEQIS